MSILTNKQQQRLRVFRCLAIVFGITLSTHSISQSTVVFEDKFERDDLGEEYEIINLDLKRLMLIDNRLLIVGSDYGKNLVILKKPPSGDFVVTTSVDIQIGYDNYVALYYWIDEDNSLSVGITGSENNELVPWSSKIGGGGWGDRRQPFFIKKLDNKYNNIVNRIPTLGNRSLAGYSEHSESWYFQLTREGVKYSAQVSVDGVRWTDLGTHVMIQNNGRIGVAVSSGRGIENAAEFNTLVIQQ